MKITFQRRCIGWGNEPSDPLEMIVNIYVPVNYKDCHYHDVLHRLERKFVRAGFHTDIGYSDGVISIFKL